MCLDRHSPPIPKTPKTKTSNRIKIHKAMAMIGYVKYNTDYTCGQCRLCKPIRKSHVQKMRDRKPTQGRCPYSAFSVLLSQPACYDHFLPREQKEVHYAGQTIQTAAIH